MRGNGAPRSRRRGFSLVELLLALAIAALLLGGLAGVVDTAFDSQRATRERVRVAREADLAMHQMVRLLRDSPRLLLPRADVAATPLDESRRPLVAFLLAPSLDRDRNGVPDADADQDGAIDEDPDGDLNGDGAPGLAGIDDDLDGEIDEGVEEDDDEDGVADEELPNGIDDDGDGAIDEDLDSDLNQDGEAGEAFFDDDGDGQVDEGNHKDDDEDEDDGGDVDEDGWDVALLRLSGTDLLLRIPLPHQTNTVEVVLASGISHFEARRLPDTGNERNPLVELDLVVGGAGGVQFGLTRRLRVGGP